MECVIEGSFYAHMEEEDKDGTLIGHNAFMDRSVFESTFDLVWDWGFVWLCPKTNNIIRINDEANKVSFQVVLGKGNENAISFIGVKRSDPPPDCEYSTEVLIERGTKKDWKM